MCVGVCDACRRESSFRSTVHEHLLIDAVAALVGRDNMLVFANASTSASGLEMQMRQFRGARVMIGGHGAGLANMLFAAPNAAVVEFPMAPHVDRCFEHMAHALGHAYHVVPALRSFYYGRYVATPAAAEALVCLLRTLLDDQGLAHLVQSHRDEL